MPKAFLLLLTAVFFSFVSSAAEAAPLVCHLDKPAAWNQIDSPRMEITNKGEEAVSMSVYAQNIRFGVRENAHLIVVRGSWEDLCTDKWERSVTCDGARPGNEVYNFGAVEGENWALLPPHKKCYLFLPEPESNPMNYEWVVRATEAALVLGQDGHSLHYRWSYTHTREAKFTPYSSDVLGISFHRYSRD